MILLFRPRGLQRKTVRRLPRRKNRLGGWRLDYRVSDHAY